MLLSKHESNVVSERLNICVHLLMVLIYLIFRHCDLNVCQQYNDEDSLIGILAITKLNLKSYRSEIVKLIGNFTRFKAINRKFYP